MILSFGFIDAEHSIVFLSRILDVGSILKKQALNEV